MQVPGKADVRVGQLLRPEIIPNVAKPDMPVGRQTHAPDHIDRMRRDHRRIAPRHTHAYDSHFMTNRKIAQQIDKRVAEVGDLFVGRGGFEIGRLRFFLLFREPPFNVIIRQVGREPEAQIVKPE